GLLVAGVSHEINNALNIIHANLPSLTRYSQRYDALLDVDGVPPPANADSDEDLDDLDDGAGEGDDGAGRGDNGVTEARAQLPEAIRAPGDATPRTPPIVQALP